MNRNARTVQARFDFDKARMRGLLNRIGAFLAGRNPDLLALDDIRRAVRSGAEHYAGVRTVELSKIVGSEGRYRDFDAAFLPRHGHTRGRWESIDEAWRGDVPLPVVSLYKAGDIYVVKDGNHRVSVAREAGAEFIDAEVVEIETPLRLAEGEDPRAALLRYEAERFLADTGLARLRPRHRIRPTRLGACDLLREHVATHRYLMGAAQGRDVGFEEAVLDWYDRIYRPVVLLIAEARLPRLFRGYSATDLYLWVMDHWHYLKKEYGLEILPEVAVADFAERFGPGFVARLRAAFFSSADEADASSAPDVGGAAAP